MTASAAGQKCVCRAIPRVSRRVSVAALSLCLSTPALADDTLAAVQPGASAPVAMAAPTVGGTSTWWQRVKVNMASTWQSNRYDIYLPLHTWHNRYEYSAQKISGYNETPWGLGAGKYFYDSEGDWHAWYAMAFLDSHDRTEPIGGYGYEKIWRPGGDWRLGAGLTFGFTARSDYHYYPIPVVLPLLSVGYGRFTMQSTNVPGGKGYGNILFTWLRWSF